MLYRFLAFVSLLNGIYSNHSSGDIRLIDRNDHVYLVYQVKNSVILADCQGVDTSDRDSCKNITEIALTEFTRNLNALYAIPGGFAVAEGFSSLSFSIDELTQEISENDSGVDTQNLLEKKLRNLKMIQRKLIRLKKSVTSKLDSREIATLSPSSGITLSDSFDPERIMWAFRPVWFDGKSKVWAYSTFRSFYFQTQHCTPPFRMVVKDDFFPPNGGSETMRALKQSKLWTAIGNVTPYSPYVWMEYKIDGDWCVNFEKSELEPAKNNESKLSIMCIADAVDF